MTPRQNLKYHPSGLCTPTDTEIDEALAAVGLAGYENALTARLSAGQKRRVALARLFLPRVDCGYSMSRLPRSMWPVWRS